MPRRSLLLSPLLSLLRLLGQGWIVLGLTVLLLLAVDRVLRWWLPEPAALRVEVGVVAPGREEAQALAGAEWAPLYWREHAAARHMGWRSYVYFRRLPFQGETIKVDAHGFRVTPQPAGCADCEYGQQVWLFGGSLVWGSGNRDAATLSAQLARELAAALPDRRIEVLNFGESGWVSQQSLAAFQLALRCPQPPAELAVFLEGANDVYASLQSGRAGLPQNERNREAEFNASRRLDRLLAAWTQRLEGIARLLPGPPAVEPERLDRLAAETAASILATREQAQALAAARGVETLHFWQPTVFERQPPRGDEARIVGAALAAHRQLHLGTRQFLLEREDESQQHDLGAELDRIDAALFFDFVHLAEAGQLVLAQALAKQLLPHLERLPTRPLGDDDCSERPVRIR